MVIGQYDLSLSQTIFERIKIVTRKDRTYVNRMPLYDLTAMQTVIKIRKILKTGKKHSILISSYFFQNYIMNWKHLLLKISEMEGFWWGLFQTNIWIPSFTNLRNFKLPSLTFLLGLSQQVLAYRRDFLVTANWRELDTTHGILGGLCFATTKDKI